MKIVYIEPSLDQLLCVQNNQMLGLGVWLNQQRFPTKFGFQLFQGSAKTDFSEKLVNTYMMQCFVYDELYLII